MIRLSLIFLSYFAGAATLVADEPFALERCELVPLPKNQVSFQIKGVEKTRWHFADDYPRPFFYPFNGPSGVSLTRMGHPGAPDHDHHRSIWIAHSSVNGQDFWADGTGSRVRQRMWYVYRDGNDETIMASLCGWFDRSEKLIMEQDLVAALIPLADGEHALEIQITMRPPGKAKTVELGKSNFGILAVRVAKTLSVHFGEGMMTNSEGQKGEANVFGKRARWMDYSGPVAVGRGADRKAIVEGITYFDHPENPRYPTHWHVREDGWMGASFCMHAGFTVTSNQPLTLRYLLHAHSGHYDDAKAKVLHKVFSDRGGFDVSLADEPHSQFKVERATNASD